MLHNLSAIFHELQTGTTYSVNSDGKEENESKITELDELPEEEVRRDSDAMEQSRPEGNREYYGMITKNDLKRTYFSDRMLHLTSDSVRTRFNCAGIYQLCIFSCWFQMFS